MKKDDQIEIAADKVEDGVIISLNNATNLLKTSELLDSKHYYQSCIFSVCLTIEEYFKCIEIVGKWKKNEGISREQCTNLFTDHKYKYTHVLKQLTIDNLFPTSDIKKSNKEQLQTHKNFLIEINQFRFFDTLKQLCMYGYWNKNKWYDFTNIPKPVDLTYFMICNMKRVYGLALYVIEDHVNRQRKNGKSVKSIKLRYTEFREFDNYESTRFLKKYTKEMNVDLFKTGQIQLNTIMKEFDQSLTKNRLLD